MKLTCRRSGTTVRLSPTSNVPSSNLVGSIAALSQWLVEKVDLLFQTELGEVHGDDQIQEVVVQNNQTGEKNTLAAVAVFVFIGEKPQSDFVADLASCTASGLEGSSQGKWRTLKRDS